MKLRIWQNGTFWLLAGGLAATFVLRTALAAIRQPPRFNDLFTALAVGGSLVLLVREGRLLHRRDWAVALALGGVVGAGMYFTTLFSPYPFWGVVHSREALALARGICTGIAALGGLVVMRKGGPVRLRAADGEWLGVGISLGIGLLTGLPLAILNVFALQLSEGQTIAWQSPGAALLDALQPGIVEEVIYRFALLGLFWLALRRTQPEQAAWQAGILAMLVHTFMHFDELFLQAPLAALRMGVVLALLWGLPLTALALRRDLDSAMVFHWVQDVARFVAGF